MSFVVYGYKLTQWGRAFLLLDFAQFATPEGSNEVGVKRPVGMELIRHQEVGHFIWGFQVIAELWQHHHVSRLLHYMFGNLKRRFRAEEEQLQLVDVLVAGFPAVVVNLGRNLHGQVLRASVFDCVFLQSLADQDELQSTGFNWLVGPI